MFEQWRLIHADNGFHEGIHLELRALGVRFDHVDHGGSRSRGVLEVPD